MKANNHDTTTELSLPALLGRRAVRSLTSLALLLALCLPCASVSAQTPGRGRPVATSSRPPVGGSLEQKKPAKLAGLDLASHKMKVSGGGTVEARLFKGSFLPPTKEKKTGAPTPSQESDTDWACTSQPGYSSYSYKDTQIFDPKLAQAYPGAIYDPKDFITGNLKEKTVARKPITITTDCYAFGNVTKTVSSPNQGTVNAKIAEMVKPDASPCTAFTVGSVRRINSYEDILVKTSGSGHYMTAGGSHEVNYQNKKKSFKYMLDIAQRMYSITVVDKNGPTDFFYTSASETAVKKILGGNPQTIDASQIDPNWVYVKSVTYGRKLVLVFESSEDLEKFGINVKAYAEGPVGGGQGEVDVRTKAVLKQVSVSGIAIGEGNTGAQVINSSLADLHKNIKAFFSGPIKVLPLAYNLSTISGDDVGINFTGEYVARECAPRADTYEVTWTKLSCEKNDDGGPNEQVKAFVRIAAFDSKGKQLLDEQKKNEKLVAMAPTESVMASLEKLGFLPWTFTRGSENAPRYLGEGDAEEPQMKLVFKVPKNEPNVRLKLTADILEFDDFNDDHFTSDSRELTLATLPGKPVKLVAKHEGSKIAFEFAVTPKYPE